MNKIDKRKTSASMEPQEEGGISDLSRMLVVVGPELALTPSELEHVTGLSSDMQRVWRSRGHLPKPKSSQARYGIRETARIFVGFELTNWGLPPGESMKIAEENAASVVYFALLNSSGTVEVTGEVEQVSRFQTAIEGNEADSLALRIAGIEGADPHRFLIAVDRNKPQPSRALPDFDTFDGPVSAQILDLVQTGIQLAERIGRPLVKIEIGKSSDWSGKQARRVIGGSPRFPGA